MVEANGQIQAAGGQGCTTGLPLLNEPAPAFRARTTQGERGLEDYRGRWLIFFAHPADFTPVCASEFIAFSKAYDRFQELGCDLLGLSVDSLFAHIAWIANIKERFGVEVPSRSSRTPRWLWRGPTACCIRARTPAPRSAQPSSSTRKG